MDQNLRGFLIGLIGAIITLSAYTQTIVSTTQGVTVGFLVLVFGLLVKEGFISL